MCRLYMRVRAGGYDPGRAGTLSGRRIIERYLIALAQAIPIAGDVSANVRTDLRLVYATAKQSAQILAFPELSLKGLDYRFRRKLKGLSDRN